MGTLSQITLSQVKSAESLPIQNINMSSSALSGLPPLPKSLSGMLNPGDSMSSPHGSAFRPIGGGGGGGGRQRQSSGGQQSLYANTRPRSQERSRKSPSVSSVSSSGAASGAANNIYVNTAEVRASSYSPSGGRKWT